MNNAVNKCLKSPAQVALDHGRQQFAALSQMVSNEESYCSQSKGLQKSLFICKDRLEMTACKIVIYGCSRGTLTVLILLDSMFFDVLNAMFMIVIFFRLEYGVPFVEAKTKKQLELIPKASSFSQREVEQPANDTFGVLKQCCNAPKHSNLFRMKRQSVSSQPIWTIRLLQLLEMLIHFCFFALARNTLKTGRDQKGVFLFVRIAMLERRT